MYDISNHRLLERNGLFVQYHVLSKRDVATALGTSSTRRYGAIPYMDGLFLRDSDTVTDKQRRLDDAIDELVKLLKLCAMLAEDIKTILKERD
uniref:Uncharacterized protein n=1 Tax=viral metagenome TaxID=1070528 RepID=A0A6M3L1T6_9ZZZZ